MFASLSVVEVVVVVVVVVAEVVVMLMLAALTKVGVEEVIFASAVLAAGVLAVGVVEAEEDIFWVAIILVDKSFERSPFFSKRSVNHLRMYLKKKKEILFNWLWSVSAINIYK